MKEICDTRTEEVLRLCGMNSILLTLCSAFLELETTPENDSQAPSPTFCSTVLAVDSVYSTAGPGQADAPSKDLVDAITRRQLVLGTPTKSLLLSLKTHDNEWRWHWGLGKEITSTSSILQWLL